MTLYVILVQDEGGHWEELGQTNSRSKKSAISQAINGPAGAAPKEGRFQAVPVRSWKPAGHVVEVETKTALKFS